MIIKKNLLLRCILVGLVCLAKADTTCNNATCIIDQQAIDQAQKTVASELSALTKKRTLYSITSATILAAGAYGFYRWLQSVPPVIPSTGQATTAAVFQSAAEPQGYLQWAKYKIGHGITGALGIFPYLFVHLVAGNLASATVAKAWNRFDHYYRSLDWHWMVSERTRLYLLMANLKSITAALDPKSTVFDSLKNVQINFTDHASVTNNNEQIAVCVFDELVKLRLLAQKSSENNRAFYEKQLTVAWQAVVDAILLNLGFIAYKQQTCKVGVEFDAHQLESMRDQIIDYTNNVTRQLPKLLQQTNTQTSGGLLSLIYEYCNYIAHTCAILEINPIVSGS